MPFQMKLLAYCGLYCAQCSVKTAYEEQDRKHLDVIPAFYAKRALADCACECCKGYSICGPCKIRDCASAKKIDSCADCGNFPCTLNEAFGGDGQPHHAQAVENLREIRESGPEAWFDGIAPALQCNCGQRQSWYFTCPEHKNDRGGKA